MLCKLDEADMVLLKSSIKLSGKHTRLKILNLVHISRLVWRERSQGYTVTFDAKFWRFLHVGEKVDKNLSISIENPDVLNTP